MNLYPWQRAFIERFRKLLPTETPSTQNPPTGLICAAPPGAGKTLAAILAAEGAAKVLVIAPPGRVCDQWKKAIRRAGLPAHLFGGEKESGEALFTSLLRANSCPILWAILPWSRLARYEDGLAILKAVRLLPPWDVLIVDESHYAQGGNTMPRRKKKADGSLAKNPSGSRARVLLGGGRRWDGIRHHARRTIGLTGTPVTSSPTKIRAQLLLAGLDHPARTSEHTAQVLGNRYDYEARFWGGRKIPGAFWTTKPYANSDHEPLVAKALYLVPKEILCQQLPAHRRELWDGIAEGPELSAEAEGSLARYLAAVHAGKDALPPLEEIADIRRQGTQERGTVIGDLVREWAEEAEPTDGLLLWTMYQDSARYLEDILLGLRVQTESHHGGKTASQRKEALGRFLGGFCRVLVATVPSLGTGVDGLQTRCCRALVAETPWTPGDVEQMEGRIVRSGQTQPVLTTWICAGVERKIIASLGLKADTIDAVTAAGVLLDHPCLH